MQCNQCGATVRPGSKLCSNCGARLGADNARQGGRGGNSDYESAPYPPSRAGRDEPGDNNRLVSRPPSPDPMADPRAPRFLKGLVPPSRREGGSREGGSRDTRSGGDRRGQHQDYPDYGPPPGPERRGLAYGNRFDEGNSAEMSAEYSAEMSAEYSAEYPDPRGYNQRGASYDPRAAEVERRDSGRGRQNDVQPDYGDRRSAAEPPRPYQPNDRYDPRDGYDARDRYDPRNRWDAPDPAAEGARTRSPSRTPRGRGGGGWEALDRDEYAANRPGMPGNAQSGLWQASKQSPSRRRRRPTLLLVAIFVILAVSVGAVGVLLKPEILSRLHGGATVSDNAPPFVSYTPGPTPTPPANFKEFDSTHALYVLDYPMSWTESTSTSGGGGTNDYVDSFTRASPAASLTVEQAGAFATITRAEIIQAEVHGAAGPGRTFTPLANPIATMEIAGEQWVRNDFLVSEPGSLQFHMAILACHHNQRGYAIVLVSLPNNFSQDSQAAFEPILNSLHFEG